jgi:hypothetical protein
VLNQAVVEKDVKLVVVLGKLSNRHKHHLERFLR